MTPDQLDLRIRQMHASLGGMATADLSTVVVHQGVEDGRFYSGVDFSEGVPDTQVMNMAEKLIENIARIRDHLKVWCTQNGRAFAGDTLINGNRSVALVHDLWNTQKHAELNRPPRSGVKPHLAEVRRSMRLITGGSGPSAVMMTFDKSGKPVVKSTGGGRGELVVDGDILDENGARVGGLMETCEEAVGEWERALASAGVAVPRR